MTAAVFVLETRTFYLQHDLHREDRSENVVGVAKDLHVKRNERESSTRRCRAPCLCESYDVSEGVRFDGILRSQRDAAEDDEDEDEVGEVGMMDEVVARDS